MSARIGLVRFPGSNCEADCLDVFKMYFGIALVPIWHTERTLPEVDGLIIPGGFSYGDYLRSGHLATLSPIMAAIKEHAKKGKAILGICNGFQILTEAGLLPGALLRNASQHFVCKWVDLEDGARTLRIPIAHGQGRYYIDPEGLKTIEDQGQIAFTYLGENPNGSERAIAGVRSANGRVLGLMPHPERACDRLLGGSEDGLIILKEFLASFL